MLNQHTRALRCAIVIASLGATAASAFALPRDSVQKAAFRREHPCPSTGKVSGPCPGYQVDHKQALMNGGSDKPSNMQWLAEQDHKSKTKLDRAECSKSYFCKSQKMKKKAPWAQAARKPHAAKKKGAAA